MSRATILALAPGRLPATLVEYRNPWGWSPSIWRRLLGDDWLGRDADLAALWQSIESLPEWQQVPLLMTFDTGVIPWQRYAFAADMVEEFERRLPAAEGQANHLPNFAALLRSAPECPYIGAWGTSVTDNPFTVWRGDDDTGRYEPVLPCEWYLLERWREFAPSS